MTVDRMLTPEQQEKVRQHRAQGWSADAIANLYGISRRSVYRYLKGELVEVRVGDYTTTFLLESDRNPRRAASWRKVA